MMEPVGDWSQRKTWLTTLIKGTARTLGHDIILVCKSSTEKYKNLSVYDLCRGWNSICDPLFTKATTLGSHVNEPSPYSYIC